MPTRKALTLVDLDTKKLGADLHRKRLAGATCHVELKKHMGIALLWFHDKHFVKVDLKDLLSVVQYNDDRPGGFV